MTQDTRQRALRALVAALLNSGLTPKEIQEVARSLVSDPSLTEQVARLVNVFVENLSPPAEPKRLPPPSTDAAQIEPDDFLREAEAAALPKEDFIQRLRSYSQRADWTPNPKWPRRRILKNFLNVAPQSSWQPALIALKAGRVEPDPYVDLILTRGKAKHG